jgi:hypothetical protein
MPFALHHVMLNFIHKTWSMPRNVHDLKDMSPTNPSSSSTPTSPEKPQRSWSRSIPALPDDPTHPAQIALRTYALSLSLSLGPSLIPFITSLFTFPQKRPTRSGLSELKQVLRRELGFDGFAFALTIAVGGGAALNYLWSILDSDGSMSWIYFNNAKNRGGDIGVSSTARSKLKTYVSSLSKLSPSNKTFIANILSSSIAIALLQAGRRRSYRLRRVPDPKSVPIPLTVPISAASSANGPSPTLELTLLLFVRAVDAMVQSFVFKRSEPRRRVPRSGQDSKAYAAPALVRDRLLREKEKEHSKAKRRRLTSRIDALVFWACSARSVVSPEIAAAHRPRTYYVFCN